MSTPGTAPFLIPAPQLTDAANIETAIVPLRDRIEVVLAQFLVPIGGLLSYAGSGDPAGGSWLLADGRLIDRTTFAAFFAAVGHAYNGGVDPGSNMVRLPDKRGRGSIGADNMGTVQGAAGRLPNSNRARGQNGGEERHLLSGPESGVKVHAHTATQTPHHHAFNGATVLTTSGAWANYGSGASVTGTQTQTDDQTPAITVANATAQSADNAHNNLHPYEIDNMIVRVA
jgi:microcystin-dependent protein